MAHDTFLLYSLFLVIFYGAQVAYLLVTAVYVASAMANGRSVQNAGMMETHGIGVSIGPFSTCQSLTNLFLQQFIMISPCAFCAFEPILMLLHVIFQNPPLSVPCQIIDICVNLPSHVMSLWPTVLQQKLLKRPLPTPTSIFHTILRPVTVVC
jgi:hypothetical protein